MSKIIALLFSIILFIVLLVFALNNLEPVTLKWIGETTYSLPMIVLILIAFAAGCFIGMIAMLPFAFKRRKAQKNAALQAQLIESN